MYFAYGTEEIEFLKKRDKTLGAAIDRIGDIRCEVDSDLFSSVVRHIIGQQISMKAQYTIWQKLCNTFPVVDAAAICALETDELQKFGMTFKKADYIKEFAEKVHSGAFDIDALHEMSDEEVIRALSSLSGIGVWTAEMLMTFCMQRPDIVSYGDLAILRGMRMLYRHRSIDKTKFAKYAKRYSPYGTVASLYLWAISNGAIPELTDPAPKKRKETAKKETALRQK